MDQIPSFKCRFCDFESSDIFKVANHISDSHPSQESTSTQTRNENQYPEKADTTEEFTSSSVSFEESDINKQEESVGNTVGFQSPTSDSDDYLFLCGECEEPFKTFDDCRAHMGSSHNIVLDVDCQNVQKESYKVPEYEVRSPRAPYNNSQKRKKIVSHPFMTDFKIRCSVQNNCLALFKTQDAFEIHKKCHVNVSANTKHQNRFKCCECQKGFSKWSPLKRHLWKDHSIDADMLKCECGFNSELPSSFAEHLETHGVEKNHVCDTCGLAFKQARQLRNHSVRHLSEAARSTRKGKWFAEQLCELCGRVFANNKTKNKHIKTIHLGEKPFCCSFCSHRTASLTALNIHIRTHTGEKPYQCNFCSFTTADHNALRRHKMRHNGFRQYQCPFCVYSCIQSSSIKSHMKYEHPNKEGLWSCDICNCKTVSETALLNHKAKHIKENAAGLNSKDGGAFSQIQQDKQDTRSLKDVQITISNVPSTTDQVKIDQVEDSNQSSYHVLEYDKGKNIYQTQTSLTFDQEGEYEIVIVDTPHTKNVIE